MYKKETIQLIIAFIANMIIVGYLVNRIWEGNDKAIILILLFYPVLLVINAILWLTTKSKVFKYTTLGLLLFFVPVLIISSWY